MYLDPPYPGNNCNYQHNMRSIEDHQKLAERIRKIKAKFLLSTYDLPELRTLFSGYNTVSVEFPAGMQGHRGRKNQELIIMNYEPGAS